jgi:hypothetical protein
MGGAVGAFSLLFALISTSIFRAARRETNWLVRIRGSRVLIKFRSYQNWKMPAENDVQVVELSPAEIEFVRERRERQVSEGMDQHGTEVARRVEMEIGVKGGDTSELEKALAEDRKRPGWGNEHHRSKSLDYPVAAGDGVIRVMWKNNSSRVTPGIKRALTELGAVAVVREIESGVEDYSVSALKRLSEEEQRKRLGDLARRDLMGATMTAKTLYGCSLGEARERVEKFVSGE